MMLKTILTIGTLLFINSGFAETTYPGSNSGYSAADLRSERPAYFPAIPQVLGPNDEILPRARPTNPQVATQSNPAPTATD